MEEATYRIQSLARGLAMLTEVASSDADLTAAELSRRIGVSRQTAYHLLHTLRQVGFIEQDPAKRYRLGWALTSVVDGYARQVAPPTAALQGLRALAGRTGEACSLSVWSGDDVVLIAQEPGRHPVRVAEVPVGQRGALHARASAKILLARCAPERREEIIAGISYERYTARTITRRVDLERTLDQAAADGWAIDDEELVVGVVCVASYVEVDGNGLAFSVLAPTARYRANAEEYVAAALAVPGD